MTKRYTHILLLAHEAAWQPLWEMTDGSPTGEIDPKTLGLSPALLRRLETWFNVVGARMTLAAQGIDVVETEEQTTDFLVEGFYIAGDLQRELGHQTVVLYFRNSLEPGLLPTEADEVSDFSAEAIESEAPDYRSEVSFDLRSIEVPTWQKVLDLEDQKRALGDDWIAIPAGNWNRLIGRLLAAMDRAVREAGVLDRLRAAVPDITDQADRDFVYLVIAPLVVWEAEDIGTVRNDPRVALTSDELIGAPAMYLAENPAGDVDDIYGWDLEDEQERDEPFRNLSRIGGTPSRVTDLPPSTSTCPMRMSSCSIANFPSSVTTDTF